MMDAYMKIQGVNHLPQQKSNAGDGKHFSAFMASFIIILILHQELIKTLFPFCLNR